MSSELQISSLHSDVHECASPHASGMRKNHFFPFYINSERIDPQIMKTH